VSNQINISGTITNIKYYKNNFGIIEVGITKVFSGQPYSSIVTFAGSMFDVKAGCSYRIKGNFSDNEKYGKQYKIISISDNFIFNETDIIGQKKFLLSVFTEGQVESLYRLANPFKALMDKDFTTLVTAKGIGLATAENMINKFYNHLDCAKIYVELEQYNLTDIMVAKLMDTYHSAELVISKVQNNPYILCQEVYGVGWKKADRIALDGGIVYNDKRRIETFIKMYLNNCGNNGYSWVSPEVLLQDIIENLGEEITDEEISSVIHDLDESKQLHISEDKTQIGLQKYFDLENDLAKEMIRIRDGKNEFQYDDWETDIKNLELKQDWEFNKEQHTAIETLIKNNLVLITGMAGCVDCDTEYFNGEVWKKISEYQKGEKILVYNDDDTSELVLPLEYIKNKTNSLFKFNSIHLNQCISYHHNFLYSKEEGEKLISTNILSIIDKQNQEGNFKGYIKTGFYTKEKGIPITDDQLIAFVIGMLSTDINNYTFLPKRYPTCFYITIGNIELAEYLKETLQRIDKKFIMYNYGETQNMSCFSYKNILKQYTFGNWSYKCNLHQLNVICDVIMRMNDVKYISSEKKIISFIKTVKCYSKINLDFIQYAFSATGHNATFMSAGIGDTVLILEVNNSPYIPFNRDCSLDKREILQEIQEVYATDGYEYCFRVPSEKLILRRNHKIFITGNCGKTSTVNAILTVLDGNYPFAQTALSGRAAAKMAEVTGEDGCTIHRLLGSDSNTFAYNSNNQLPYDIIIVDEISMIDSKLFLYLLRAIKTGSKVILLGDHGQLESIGSGNVAYDILHSTEIPTVILTEIYRQALSSAIITESRKIRNGVQIISKDYCGIESRGEKKDFIIDCYNDKTNTFYKIMQHFSKEYIKYDNPLDIQILSPVKTRGDASIYKLNIAVQQFIHPLNSKKEHFLTYFEGEPYTIQIGDKVINTKNNYKTNPPIFNGNIGIVEDIIKEDQIQEDGSKIHVDQVIIDFIGIGRVKLNKDAYSGLVLGYAITVHKFQGSSAKVVIIGIDSSAFMMLSRELLYTAITRAEEKCILVAQNSALRYGTSKEQVNKKQTYLQECLTNATRKTLDW